MVVRDQNQIRIDERFGIARKRIARKKRVD